MTALDIFATDQEARLTGGDRLPRQQYYTDLRDALHDELTRDGYSELLDQVVTALRQKTMTDIYVLDYAALTECHSLIVNNQKLRDVTEFIPHLLKHGHRVPWDAVEFGSNMIPTNDAMLSQFRALRTVSRQMHTARSESFEGESASAQKVEQLQSLARMLDRRCRELEEERERLIARINSLEEGAVDAHLQRLLKEKREQAERDLETEFASQRQQASEAFRARYAQDMAERARANEEASRQAARAHQALADQYAQIRQDMAGDLARLEKRIASQMNRWQHALDRAECRMLAACYASLYPLLTANLDALAVDAVCLNAPEALRVGITRMQGEGADRLRQLEQAMQRLGLEVIRPVPGDAFDPEVHVSTGVAEASAADGVVASCVTPGVRIPEGEALVPAEVILC